MRGYRSTTGAGRYFILLLAVLGMLFGAGCSSVDLAATNNAPVEPPAKKTTIVFWNENAAADRTAYYKELIAQFEQENPDIHVEYVGLPKKSARLKINTAIATHDLPDVCGLQSAWIAEFYHQDVLLNLDPWFQAWSEHDDMMPAVIEGNRRMAADGGLYQLPNTMSMETLWYRPDWFAAAGRGEPQTWEDFFTAAARLNAPGSHYGFSIRGGDGAGMQLMRAMFAYSGYRDFFGSDGRCRIDDPLHIAFVKRYLGLYRKYTPTADITNGYQEMIEEFDQGKAAMIQHNIGSYGSHTRALRPESYAGAMLPLSREGTYVQEANNVDGYSIFKSSQHPEEAWRFLKFLCSARVQSWWNERIGQMPVSEQANHEKWVGKRQHLQVVQQAMDSGRFYFYQPPMYLPDYRQIVDSADNDIEQVMLGKLSVEDFLHGWAERFNQAEQAYRAAQ